MEKSTGLALYNFKSSAPHPRVVTCLSWVNVQIMNREQTEGNKYRSIFHLLCIQYLHSLFVDLKAFELRLTECVGHIRAKTRKWRCKHACTVWGWGIRTPLDLPSPTLPKKCFVCEAIPLQRNDFIPRE